MDDWLIMLADNMIILIITSYQPVSTTLINRIEGANTGDGLKVKIHEGISNDLLFDFK